MLPILDWTSQDVEEFIIERGIRLHPLYYREDGTIDCRRRLGCLGCPLQSDRGLGDMAFNKDSLFRKNRKAELEQYFGVNLD